MTTRKEIREIIKESLKKNISKADIEKELALKYKPDDYKKMLKDYPEPEAKQKYKVLNNILIACLIIATFFKEIAIIDLVGSLGSVILLISLVLGLVVPVWLILYLKTFRSSAYIVTFVLIAFSFSRGFDGIGEVFSSGNGLAIGLYIFQLVVVAVMVFSCIYLWTKIYPNYFKSSK